MYTRKLYDKMLEWKTESAGTSALLIEGARRVGKTTLILDFAKREYEDYLYIDFSKAPNRVLDLFRDYRDDTDTFLRMLQLEYFKRLPERRSAIVFDEVQQFPIAREYIKHLVADGRFDYVESGSIVSIKKNVQNILIPSEEDRLLLHPLDFEEYLWATDKHVFADAIRESRETLVPLPDSVHTQCKRLFNEYIIVGGMPQSVEAFLNTATFAACERVKQRILDLYKEDIAKFGGRDARRARAIFDAIPGQLSANSKRFKFSSLNSTSRYNDYESALFWLEDAHITNICHLCSDPNVGYKLTEDGSALKCYMADTGLLVTQAFEGEPESLRVQRELQFGRISINKGMLAENVVAQSLAATGNGLYFYTWKEPVKGENTRPRPREIDFLVTRGFADAANKPRVCPIEVKSSGNYSTISLDDFKKKFPKRVGNEIVLHTKQLKREGARQYLPMYMAFCV